MRQNRIRNILLTVVALLLFLNLVVTFAPPVHAIGKTQYRAGSLPNGLDSQERVQLMQSLLDRESAQGGSMSAMRKEC